MNAQQNISGFSFFSHTEFTLCRAIYDFMRFHRDHIYLCQESFQHDDVFVSRLSAFLQSPKSHIIHLKKPQKHADHFIQKMINILDIQDSPHPLKSLVKRLHYLYQDNHKLIFILSHVDKFSPRDIQAIDEFCTTISEKYPIHKKNFFRFIFIGAPHEYALYKKFQNKDVALFHHKPLMIYDCENLLTLQNFELEKQNTAENNSEKASLFLHHVTGQSFTSLRKLIPLSEKIYTHNEELQEKDHQFYTEILTGDLSQSEKESFLRQQKNTSSLFSKQTYDYRTLIIKAFFIFFCMIASILIWYSING